MFDLSENSKYLNPISLLVVMLSAGLIWKRYRKLKIYLVDFACHKPAESLQLSKESALKVGQKFGLSESGLEFMRKTMEKGGIGDKTYAPKGLHDCPFDRRMEAARQESETAIFGAVDAVLSKSKGRVGSGEIGILIVNCTVYNAVPSLCSIIVNRYRLREDIATFNISGMGCTAGLLALRLAANLLQVRPDTCALIVSTENITSALYTGTDISKQIVNYLFRVGASAVLLSNKSSHANSSKYYLLHAVPTNTSSSNLSYNSIFREESSDGITGVTINRDLLTAANLTIQHHLKSFAASLLPLSEKFLYLIQRLRSTPYVPKFNTAVDHFLPHVGGLPILEQLQTKLGFSEAVMEPSKMTLHRFGNTSSSSVWYELAYVEAKGRIRKGNRIWQIAFGSGFKCTSVIWRAIRSVDGDDKVNPWTEEIEDYPMELLRCGDSFPYLERLN